MKPTITVLKKRSISLLMVFCIFFVAVTARLAYIQFSWADELKDKATQQWTRKIGVYPKRGTIYDTNGMILAASVTKYSLQATPNDIADANAVAILLSPILEMSVDDIAEKLSQRNQALVWVKRLLSDEQALQIRNLTIPGLELIDEPARVYPYNNLAAQVLGFTKKYADPTGHTGQDGIELYYNTTLIGEPGAILRETDNTGKEIPFGSEIFVEAQNGSNVVLSIDSTLQMFLQEAAAESMQKWNAESVYGLASDPQTGEILAMVNLPDYDPNEPPRNLTLNEMQALTKNMTCQMNFDPGSVFKVVILAAAFEEGVISKNDTFYCPGYKDVVMENGKTRRIHCSHRNGHGTQSTFQALANSCNPAFMEIGERLGKDKVYEYIEKFGFGKKTGIDISGEESGIIINKDRAQHADWLTMCFGQAISVTPIQMMTAYNAVINGGYMIQPHILKSVNRTIENDNGTTSTEQLYNYETVIKEQVISEKTSEILREALVYTVTNGTANPAAVHGYVVGGKTGTSEVYDSSGAVSEDDHIGSFIGHVWHDGKSISVYIIVCKPQGIYYGTTVAAPHVGEFLEKALPYMGLEVSSERPIKRYMPNVVGLDVEHAISALFSRYYRIYNIEFVGHGTIIASQSIAPNTWTYDNPVIYLTLTDQEPDHTGQVQIPNLYGMSIVDATYALYQIGVKIESVGNGATIFNQSIVPGTYVDKGSTVICYFDEAYLVGPAEQ